MTTSLRNRIAIIKFEGCKARRTTVGEILDDNEDLDEGMFDGIGRTVNFGGGAAPIVRVRLAGVTDSDLCFDCGRVGASFGLESTSGVCSECWNERQIAKAEAWGDL